MHFPCYSAILLTVFIQEKWNENMCLYKDLYMNAHNNSIHFSQNWGMNEPIKV